MRPKIFASPHRWMRGVCAASTAALAVGALAAAPGVASADSQQLNSVAISINADDNLAVLDVAGSSTDPGAPLIPWTLTSGSNQRWNFVPLPDGNEKVVNQNSGMCLTTDGIADTGLYQQRCVADGYGAGPLQEWTGVLFPAIRYGTPYAGPDTSYLRNPVSNLRVTVSKSNALIAAAAGSKLNYYQL
jgi:Ricin-type beta-trefoil lectin domain-like